MRNKITFFFQYILIWIKRNKVKSSILCILLLLYYFSLPRVLFDNTYVTVIEGNKGELLVAKIARDGQWRFPEQESVPEKFKKCIVLFEDRYFYRHLGFNPMAMLNAFKQNNKARKIVRGGSTLTQQLIRLYRNGKNRTYVEKIIEVFLATRLELRYSKEKIIALYAAHAPYGGNVVGLEMASWRYFGVKPKQLSWAETATLAVLPNAPGLIYPGKNHEILLDKRNQLLKKLYQEKVIDRITYELSVEESLPHKPFALPQIAPHLLDRLSKNYEGKRIITTIDFTLQNSVNQIAKRYYNQYKENEVYNLAILVIDVNTKNVISYVGNAPTDAQHQKDVDIVVAPRSTGSILKPFLYAGMLDDGALLPNTLIADIPTQISGYTPQNYNLTYDGAVPAHRALARSLNIPSVLMLQDYGVYRFYEHLQGFGLKNISKHPNHYGLSLILGGAESNLWDLCRTYANLSGTLNHYIHSGKYRTKEFSELNLFNGKRTDFGKETFQKNILGAGSIWLTYNAMKQVNRPEGDEAWRFYDSSLEIAWKTGTSFGNRDAWAIGTTKDYVVGVWIGNATGEGRPALTGVNSAAPVLFDVFHLLPRSSWFETPFNDLEEAEVCKLSGYLAQENCPGITQFVPVNGKRTKACPYHTLIHLDNTEQFRVNSSCENIENMVVKPWFILPPVMEWYYKKKHVEYQSLPPYRLHCTGAWIGLMDFIYPKENSKIYLTKDFESKTQSVILKVAHSQPDINLFWYSNNRFIGATQHFHEMPLEVKTGVYYITVMDEFGNEIKRKIEIVKD